MKYLTTKEKIELTFIIIRGVLIIAAIGFILSYLIKPLIASAHGSKYDIDNIYAKTAIVYDLDYENDIVYISDSNGNAWSFTGIEDYELGDYVSIIMYDNDTPNIYDDIIVSVRYSGYTCEGWAINPFYDCLYSNIKFMIGYGCLYSNIRQQMRKKKFKKSIDIYIHTWYD